MRYQVYLKFPREWSINSVQKLKNSWCLLLVLFTSFLSVQHFKPVLMNLFKLNPCETFEKQYTLIWVYTDCKHHKWSVYRSVVLKKRNLLHDCSYHFPSYHRTPCSWRGRRAACSTQPPSAAPGGTAVPPCPPPAPARTQTGSPWWCLTAACRGPWRTLSCGCHSWTPQRGSCQRSCSGPGQTIPANSNFIVSITNIIIFC